MICNCSMAGTIACRICPTKQWEDEGRAPSKAFFAYGIDAVEVVRCKDCKFCENIRVFNTSAKTCRWWEKLTDEDGFCHAAKLKGEER